MQLLLKLVIITLFTITINANELDRLLRKNAKRLENAGIDLSNPKLAKSLLMSAHLGGVKSTIALYKNGIDYEDEDRISIKRYYQPAKIHKTV